MRDHPVPGCEASVAPLRDLTRRHLFQRLGFGVGGLALSSLLHNDTRAIAPAHGAPAACRPHVSPRARSVIYIHLVGAPSQLDLFDYKPELCRRDGQLCPAELFEGKKFAFLRARPTMLGTPTTGPFRFRQCGQSGAFISDLLPNLQQVADEICWIKTLHTDEFNHAPAQLFLLTGFGQFGRPSVGSWLTYGLGSENANLPGFVVLLTGNTLGAGNSAWGSGFLPTVYQGVEFRGQGDPVLFLSNPSGVDATSRRRMVDAVNELNRTALADLGDPEIATRISQYELAYRMQTSVPALMNIADEPDHIRQLYGATPGEASFANNCLLARRLVEQGVRFVQLFDQGWDMHSNVFQNLPRKTKQVDRPIAALIHDLKARGMLDETLVVWSAEFGRTPMAQGASSPRQKTSLGRDHHKDAYTVWLAGGGVRSGFSYGQTDELGYSVAQDPVHVHDLNATLMHLMGIDHERLTFGYQGRQFRLTDVHGRIVSQLFAS